MNQSVTHEAQKQAAPFLNVTEIQMRTTQKLLQEQADLMRECMEVSTRNTASSSDPQDMTSFWRAPLEVGQQVQARFLSSLSRQWEILVDARNEMNGIAESAQEDLKKGMNKAQEKAREATSQIEENVEQTQRESKATARKETAKQKDAAK